MGENTIKIVTVKNNSKGKSVGKKKGINALNSFSKNLAKAIEKQGVSVVPVVVDSSNFKQSRAEIRAETTEKYILWLVWDRYTQDGSNGGVLTVSFNVDDTEQKKLIWQSTAKVNVSLGLSNIAVNKVVDELAQRKLISVATAN